MLHSLSHMLMTAIALDCGYPASSLRERVYAGEQEYGILIYTGSSDSEGTLGGLVQAGRRLLHYLLSAYKDNLLCSNDPICAEHDPSSFLEERPLHGAACHGCLLTSETSCEQRNDFLDRALVMPTVGTPDGSFLPVARLSSMIVSDEWRSLEQSELARVADLLESGFLVPPFTELGLRYHVGGPDAGPLLRCFSELRDKGMTPPQMAVVLRAYLAGRTEVADHSSGNRCSNQRARRLDYFPGYRGSCQADVHKSESKCPCRWVRYSPGPINFPATSQPARRNGESGSRVVC